MTLTLEQARVNREQNLLFERIDDNIKILFAHDSESYSKVSELRTLMRYYAAKVKPYTSCVIDNMERFGPGRTENVCATLNDVIRRTHNYHKGTQAITASAEAVATPDISEEMAAFLLSIPREAIDEFERKVFDAS